MHFLVIISPCSQITENHAANATGMSDPDAAEPPPPAQPPRRAPAPTAPTSTEEAQMAADERYARQLAEHYNGAVAYGGNAPGPRRGQARGPPAPLPEEYDSDRDRSFFDGTEHLSCVY